MVYLVKFRSCPPGPPTLAFLFAGGGCKGFNASAPNRSILALFFSSRSASSRFFSSAETSLFAGSAVGFASACSETPNCAAAPHSLTRCFSASERMNGPLNFAALCFLSSSVSINCLFSSAFFACLFASLASYSAFCFAFHSSLFFFLSSSFCAFVSSPSSVAAAFGFSCCFVVCAGAARAGAAAQ